MTKANLIAIITKFSSTVGSSKILAASEQYATAQTAELQKEVERLKGVIRNMWECNYDFEHNSAATHISDWNKFKSETNL